MDSKIVLQALLTDDEAWRAQLADAIDALPTDDGEYCWWLDERWLAAELEALVDGRDDEDSWRYGGA